jgi:transposase
MHLMIDKSKYGHKTLYVYKSFRNENGKSTSKCVERLGRYDDLKEIHDDPIAWAKAYIEELNKQESVKVSITYSTNKQIEKDVDNLFDGGYMFLQKIFYDLGLDKICKSISKRYSFKYDLTDILSVLINGRILFPKSKSATFEDSKYQLESHDFDLQDVYRSLEVIAKEKDFIQSELYKNSLSLSKRNDKILYYDCTNYYFEIEKESGIRKYGVSKEHRPNPIVEMGLFMDGDGIPLAFCLTDGNVNEQKTLQPLEQQIIDDFHHSKFIVCTDAGLSSTANRKFNDVYDRAFITAQSIKKMKDFQKEWALSTDGWRLPGTNDIFNLDNVLNDEKLCEKYRFYTFYKEQWFNEHNIEQRFIVTFSIKYMIYQRSIRNEQIERAKKALSSDVKREKYRQSDYKRFICRKTVTDDGEVAEKKIYSLNEEKILNEEKYDGFYAVATNLEDPAPEIIRVNHRRWEIEESFRIMKHEFSARPVYLSRDDRITAHFTTCFLALTIYRYLEKRIGHGYTCNELVEQLKAMKFYKTREGYIPVYTRTDLTDALHERFGFRTDYQLITHSEMKKIIKATKKKTHTTKS